MQRLYKNRSNTTVRFQTVSLTTYLFILSTLFHTDECYDARNIITCEDELEKGNCGDIEVAHACSETCQTLSCAGRIHEIVHEHRVTNYISSFLQKAGPFTEKIPFFFPLTF